MPTLLTKAGKKKLKRAAKLIIAARILKRAAMKMKLKKTIRRRRRK